MMQLSWLSILLSLAATASAFQGGKRMYAPAQERLAGSAAVASMKVDSHRPWTRSPSTSTRLKYRDGSDETNTASPFKWISTMFPYSKTEADEQESVDEYLEFLERRYRRLHKEPKEEPTKPFSALNWLKQGSTPSSEIVATEQQQEDALYVLGVAGLASQKLLSKHHIQTDNSKAMEPVPAPVQKQQPMDVVDVDIVPPKPVQLVIKKVIVPLIRVVFVAQRRKDMFVAAQLQRLKSISKSAARSVAKSIVQGPSAAARAVLDVGGGRKSLALTLAVASTLFVLTRPIVQAAIQEKAMAL